MSLSPLELTDLRALAERAARAAGAVLLERFGAPARGLATKSSVTDMVSDADRRAEEAILELIAAERPGDRIVAEEAGTAGAGDGPLRWVIDPLDGTTNYLVGLPHWAVSVAVEDAAGGVVGVVLDPLRGEVYRAIRGGGAEGPAGPLRTSEAADLTSALIGTGFNYRPAERARQAKRMAAILPAVRDVRRFGAASLDLCWLAAGRLDGFFETGLERWDWAAAAVVIREAGGDLRELAPHAGSPGGVVAAGANLIDPLADLVAGSYP